MTPGPSPTSPFRLDGSRALVVGGYGGIGRVVSELFHEQGAAVAVAGRSLEKAQALADELASRDGAEAMATSIDVADRAGVDAAVESVVQRLGGLEIVVNVSGIDLQAPAEELSEGDWDQVIAVNLSGAFWLSQAAGRRMIPAGGGRIVHFSSTRGAAAGRRGFAAYGASKAGVDLLVKQLATEWGRYRINVNAIAPGFVPTGLVAPAAEEKPFVAMMLNRIPMGRFGEPLEMAATALFLASPAASFVTGQVVYVDGGVMASS